MVRCHLHGRTPVLGSPHTRGDGPVDGGYVYLVRTFSPHAWGWSDGKTELFTGFVVLPTRVGMVRIAQHAAGLGGGSPHTRGDGPMNKATLATTVRFSPHAWGWSVCSSSPHTHHSVLPTRVGMVRGFGARHRCLSRSPHTRGDGPRQGAMVHGKPSFSPHAWGWSRLTTNQTAFGARSPHTRGDGPLSVVMHWGFGRFSPHAWGWSAFA